MHGHSLHEVRADAFNYVWDNSIAPVLEVESGAEVELHVRDAGDEQIGPDSGVDAVVALDFSHVNPVSGPVAVKGARPGDVLAVEILELRPRDWGWTAIIPGFGLLADEFPDPWLRISRVDEATRRVVFAEGVTLPFEPFPARSGWPCPSPASTRSCRRRSGAATSTSSTCVPARRCICRSASTERCSRSATPTPRWATARCAAPPSRRRWTSSCA